jgi:ferredoxin--NADP+ reductase
MNEIREKKVWWPDPPAIKEFVVKAPWIAEKHRAGQFVILRVSDNGERIPLTISDSNNEDGTINILFQEVGATTMALGRLNEGDKISDLTGPLGRPTHIEKFGTVVCVGGGIGVAPVEHGR